MIKKFSRSKIALILSLLFVMVMMMTACSAIDFKVDFIVDGEVYHTISTKGNEVVKMPTDPSKEGYTFDGWFWDKDVWDKPFTANSLLDAPLSDNMSIFAKWKEIVSRQTITVENPTYTGEALVYGDKLPIITTTTTGGTIALNAGQTLSVGTKDYNWTFTPIDSQNYNWLNTTGAISLTVIAAKASGCEIISAEGFKIEGRNASRKISNATNSFSFINVIKVSQGATWQVSTDINGVNVIPTKTISLNEGDNTVYILVTAANGEDLSLYTFTIRRRLIYTVICKNADGTSFSTQSIEEDSLAVEPTNKPSNSGYDFSGWSFDFNAPITNSVNIEPKWNIITYTITYDNLLDGTNPNANIIDYTVLTESIILVAPTRTGYTGAWDIARIDKGSVGNKIITANWTINKYTLATIKSLENAGSITAGGAYDDNTTQTITATCNLGYKWLGWYNGSALLTTAVSYTFNMPAENVTYEARWAMDELLTNFTFSSTENTLTITKYNGVASDVVIPNGVTSIGERAFYACSGLTSITIGSGVASIGAWAFYKCSGLTSITIPNSVTSIGYAAFNNCSGLTSIMIPNRVTSIGQYAFNNCSGLTSITIPFVGNTLDGTTNTGFGYIFGASKFGDNGIYVPVSLRTVIITGGTSIGGSAFRECSGLTSIIIPNSVTSIGYAAFNNCSGLTSITIPNSVTSIDGYAFLGCSGLTSITIPFVGNTLDGTTNTGFGYIFGANINIENESVVPSGLRTVVITGGTSIGDQAFYGCSGLTSITIPNSMTSIAGSAFYACNGLSSIMVNGGNLKYHSADNCIIETTTNTLIAGCKNSAIPTGGSVTSIGDQAFYGCSGLTLITIPNSVTSIGDQVFYGCSGLTSITIPNRVISIGVSAFEGCSVLTSITIGSGVTSIGGKAFAGCGRLTTVYIDSLTVANSINKTSHGGLLEKATTIYIKDDLAFSNAYFNTLSLVGTETVNNIVYKKYI